ncbi:MAG: hypothetical protein GXO19_01990 [Epsilonproteobacteria bacterium]|nr:hypothetical protein [Campylobacterota bacterium]
MTLYLYRRNRTLYFVFKHPGFVMEINYNKKLIKDLLTLLRERYKVCRHIEIEQIRAYAKFLPPEEKSGRERWEESYEEWATGNFPSSENFPELFEKIKEAIRRNRGEGGRREIRRH